MTILVGYRLFQATAIFGPKGSELQNTPQKECGKFYRSYYKEDKQQKGSIESRTSSTEITGGVEVLEPQDHSFPSRSRQEGARKCILRGKLGVRVGQSGREHWRYVVLDLHFIIL
jgi:hypothetical protein